MSFHKHPSILQKHENELHKNTEDHENLQSHVTEPVGIPLPSNTETDIVHSDYNINASSSSKHKEKKIKVKKILLDQKIFRFRKRSKNKRFIENAEADVAIQSPEPQPHTSAQISAAITPVQIRSGLSITPRVIIQSPSFLRELVPETFEELIGETDSHQLRGANSSRKTIAVGKTGVGICAECGSWKKNHTALGNVFGLLLIFIVFASICATVFHYLESGPEHERRTMLSDRMNTFLETHPCVNRTDLFTLIEHTIEDDQIAWYIITNSTNMDRWEFINSFGFVIALVTTIGYGTLAPNTNAGKVACVVVAIAGIPFTLIVLSSIGQKLGYYYARLMIARPCHEVDSYNRVLKKTLIIIITITVVFIIPSLVFAVIENWDFGEALYFAFTTLSTVGFGDYVIGITGVRQDRLEMNAAMHQLYVILAYIWILIGLSYLSLCYSVIMESVVSAFSSIIKVAKPKRKGPPKEMLIMKLSKRRRPGYVINPDGTYTVIELTPR